MAKKADSEPPALEFSRIAPLQDYYDDGDGNYYSVAKLLDDAKDLPVFDCPVAALNLSGMPWQDSAMFDLAWHVKKCMEADLSEPILLDWWGRIADGRHRVIKAIAQGKRSLKAQRMTWKPTPCHAQPKD